MPRSKAISEQMRAQSRAAILDSARKLFAERGYAGCKVGDIALEAGMSPGNVYWYFSSKEALLKAVLADGFDKLGQLMARVAARSGSGREKLDHLLDEYLAFGREGGEFTRILLAIIAQGGIPRLLELGLDTRQIGMGYHQSVSAILAQGQAEGLVAQDIDPQLLTMFFFAFFNGLQFTYGAEWLDVPPVLLRDAVLRLLGNKESVAGAA